MGLQALKLTNMKDGNVMLSKISSNYISNRAWLRDVVGGREAVLCRVSALEFLEMFVGYINEKNIYVYAKDKCLPDNVQCSLVNSFDGIEYLVLGNVMCTTFNQTINDMLRNINNEDESAIIEALSNYYYAHGESFDGLDIATDNIAVFQALKPVAMDYYSGG